ncbi:mitotic fidelity of chromosome transmission-related protein [Rhodosporidiobolus nylandii]
MAPPTPGRHRGPRPQVNNNIGEAGRTTNIVPPKHVPRDSAGHERADEFFDRAIDGEYDEDEEMHEAAPAAKAKQSAKKKVVANGAGRERKGERPDRFMLGEDRGRKTGVVKAALQRDEEGFEDINNFFQSPSPTRSTATAKSTVKSRRNGQLFNPVSPEYEENGFDEDESDMQVDDGTSLSPTTYQRQHPSSARRPSSLRHSTNASGSHSHSRKGLATSSPNSPRKTTSSNGRRRLSSLSGSGDEADDAEQEDLNLASSEDDEAEDEVVRAALGANRFGNGGGSAMKPDKGKGKAPRVPSEDEEEQEVDEAYGDAQQEEDDEEDEEEETAPRQASTKKKQAAPRQSNGSAASPSTRGSPNGSSGLLKLDKNGRPVAADRKGKGKEVVRSPSPPQEDYYDQQEYGGGFDEDDEDGGDGQGFDDGFQRYDPEDFEEEEDPNAPGPSNRPAKAPKKGKAPAAPKGKKTTRTQSDSDSPPSKKSAGQRRKAPDSSQTKVIEKVVRKRGREEGTVDIDGVRRSTRQRIEPLEYWRNERVIYKRRSSGVGMNAIVRVPKEEPAPLTKAGKKKGAHSKRGSSAKPSSRSYAVKDEHPDEEGCDDMTDPDGLVWSWEGDAEISRRVAFTRKMMDPKPTFDGKFSFQKIYQELDYLAGGIMVIAPGGRKDSKPARDNSYVFYCIQGSVSVTIHRARFTIGPGGTFFVPRGNQYAIEATSNREVRLFFAQGRRVIELPDGFTRPDTKEDSQSYVQQQLDAVPEEDEESEEEEEEEDDE